MWMNNKKKRQQRIYDLLNAETNPKFLYVLYTKQKNYRKRAFLRKKSSGGLKKNEKKAF